MTINKFRREFEMSHTATPNAALTDIGAAGTAANPEILMEEKYTEVQFEVVNADAGDALQDFALLVKPHRSGAWTALITGAAWATIANVLTFKSASLNTLAAASTAIARVSLGPCYSIKFQGRAAANTVDLTIRGTLLG